MDASTFVSRIRSAGFDLAANGEKLTITPASRLTDSQRQFIKTHKPALLAILTGKTPPAPPPDPLNPTNDPELSRLLALPAIERMQQLMWAGYRMEYEGGQLVRVVRLADIEGEPEALAEDQHQGDTDTGRVCCGDCGHFERDRIGDGSGIGACAVLDRPPGGLLYPRIDRRCSRFEAITTDASEEGSP